MTVPDMIRKGELMTSIATHLKKAEEHIEKADFVLKQTLSSDEEFDSWCSGRLTRDQALEISNLHNRIAQTHLEAAKARNM